MCSRAHVEANQGCVAKLICRGERFPCWCWTGTKHSTCTFQFHFSFGLFFRHRNVLWHSWGWVKKSLFVFFFFLLCTNKCCFMLPLLVNHLHHRAPLDLHLHSVCSKTRLVEHPEIKVKCFRLCVCIKRQFGMTLVVCSYTHFCRSS